MDRVKPYRWVSRLSKPYGWPWVEPVAHSAWCGACGASLPRGPRIRGRPREFCSVHCRSRHRHYRNVLQIALSARRMLRARQAKSDDIAELDAIVADLRALLHSPTVERIASRLVDVLRRRAMSHMTYRLLTLQEAIALFALSKSIIYTAATAGVVHRYRLPNGRRILYHEHELGIIADVYISSGVHGVRRLIASGNLTRPKRKH